MQIDRVILVNEMDEAIGEMDKLEAHKGEGKLHRAISVFLFDQSGKLLIQQRSEKKIVGALQWANTCCGNVRPGETYYECALRRLREELGITRVELNEVVKFRYQVKCNEEFSENEIDTVFIGEFDGKVTPNPDEVHNYEFVVWESFIKRIKQRDRTIVPWVFSMEEKGILYDISRVTTTRR